MEKAAQPPCCPKIAPDKHVFDIVELINIFHAWYARVLSSKEQRLTSQISSEIPRYFHGNPLLLRHLFYQIGKNSLLYIDEGKAHLEIKAEHLAGRRHTISFIITLTGTSMPLGKQRQLFQSARTQNDWQGLDQRCSNLYYARTVARGFGGDIRIQSDAGYGTRYRVEVHLSQGSG